MLITYVDESERGQQIYFIGALTVTEASVLHIEDRLNSLVRETSVQVSSLPASAELHGWEVYHGKQQWTDVPPRLRAHVCKQAIKIIADSGARFVLRGTDRNRHNAKYHTPYPIHELTLSHVLGETNERIIARYGHEAHSLVLADEHHTAEDGRRRFKSLRDRPSAGYASKPLTQMVDTIYFGPSHHSRLLQAADMVTYFSNRALTVEDADPRAAAAMAVIRADLDRMTDQRYIWP